MAEDLQNRVVPAPRSERSPDRRLPCWPMHCVNLSTAARAASGVRCAVDRAARQGTSQLNIDSCKTVWKNAALTLTNARKLNHVLYADDGQKRSKGRGHCLAGATPTHRMVTETCLREDAMAKGGRRGQHDDREGQQKWFAIATLARDDREQALRNGGASLVRLCAATRPLRQRHRMMAAERGIHG